MRCARAKIQFDAYLGLGVGENVGETVGFSVGDTMVIKVVHKLVVTDRSGHGCVETLGDG